MGELNENSFCFITCVNNEEQYKACRESIEKLDVPDNMRVEIIAITDATSMASGYNEGMAKSDAKYKIYLHQDVRITNKDFLHMLLRLFTSNPDVGIAGPVGSSDISRDGIWWDGTRVGSYRLQLSENDSPSDRIFSNSGGDKITYAKLLDGLMLCTQYDVRWRDDIFRGFDFYDVSECMEFINKGYKVAVFYGNEPWVIHINNEESLHAEYFADRRRFQREYRIGLDSEMELNRDINDFRNPKIYIKLAEKYEKTNPKLAYLSIQNADLYESDPEARKDYADRLKKLEVEGFSAPNVSIIILNYKNADMTIDCVNSIKRWCSPADTEIIVVDNNSCDDSVERLSAIDNIKLICNTENRGFPGGCNDGIKAASPENDIFLLNNDTLMTPNAIFTLRMALYEDENTGAAGSMASSASNGQQVPFSFYNLNAAVTYGALNNFPNGYDHEKKIYLLGNALLIRRSVLNKIGLLDERFNPGNFEDNDLCLRIMQAGYKNILCHDSFIVHYGSQSFKKDPERFNALLEQNRNKINQKYGLNILYYSYPRTDLIELIDNDEKDDFTVLEAGCGFGATLNFISYLYPNAHCRGIEISSKVAGTGKANGDIINADIESNVISDDERYDYIIFGDVIEHLKDPIAALKALYPHLKEDGHLLISIPNIMHYSVIIPLLCGQYSWDPEGIRDYTHLHCFTANTIITMLDQCGFKPDIVRAKRVDFPYFKSDEFSWFWDLVKSGKISSQVEFETYQYIVKASKK